MEQKSKVKSVTGMGHWDSPNGRMFKWEVIMENGQTGQAMTKDQDQKKWIVGQEVTYTSEQKGNYTNFKLVQEKPKFVDNKDHGVITMLSCISSACTVVQQSSNYNNTELIKKMASEFFDLAMSKSTK